MVLKIRVVLKRTLKLFTAVILKRTNYWLGRCSTASAVWRGLTAGEVKAVAGLVAADVLAVRWWWLEEGQPVVAFHLVKTVFL